MAVVCALCSCVYGCMCSVYACMCIACVVRVVWMLCAWMLCVCVCMCVCVYVCVCVCVLLWIYISSISHRHSVNVPRIIVYILRDNVSEIEGIIQRDL